MRLGVRSVTMDDISKALGMSKKTLYQYVSNKTELVDQTITCYLECEQDIMKALREEANDAIEEIVLISKHVNKLLQSVHPATMFDLQKYYRQQWTKIKSLENQFIYNIIKENLERGMAQGIYRQDINSDITARLYVLRADMIIDSEIFPIAQYNRPELHNEFVKYHLHAIISDEGRDLLKKYYATKQ